MPDERTRGRGRAGHGGWWLTTALGAVLAIGGSVLAGGTPASPQEAPPAPTGPCGGIEVPDPTAPGETWSCTLSEEFDGTQLNRGIWTPQETAKTTYQSGEDACFVNDPDNIRVVDGVLELTARDEGTPFSCPSLGADGMTQYTSGSITSNGRFFQTYGRFEIRAHVPAAILPGLQFSFWLYPQNRTFYGARWPASGEIDVMEWYHAYPFLGIPYLHYVGDRNDPKRTNVTCVVANMADFHTYTVEWTPTAIRFLYDGRLCLENTRWTPLNGITMPAPFDRPFNVNLTQALGVVTNQFMPGITPLPATTQIDYVRVWG